MEPADRRAAILSIVLKSIYLNFNSAPETNLAKQNGA
jgi:hypothetical protein